jgi:hypothetical protein
MPEPLTYIRDRRVGRELAEHNYWIVPIYLIFVFTSIRRSGQCNYKFLQNPSSKPFLFAHLLNHHDLAVLKVKIVALEDDDALIKNTPNRSHVPL